MQKGNKRNILKSNGIQNKIKIDEQSENRSLSNMMMERHGDQRDACT